MVLLGLCGSQDPLGRVKGAAPPVISELSGVSIHGVSFGGMALPSPPVEISARGLRRLGLGWCCEVCVVGKIH